ncbi:MAG: cytochrome d ubiquinol oxidase subunit II [Methylococcaceae bacterium]|nr:cytochrome d ubiquinol oxidase subunit II [Methylococcaceae bacterium]
MTLDYETLKVIWWLFIGILFIGFAIMDGFDLGIGIVLPFIGKTDDERRVLLNVVGPTWEGSQVWFVTAAGALFAAWPLVYATLFSGIYIALFLVLFTFFLRPVGFDYRSKLPDPRWRNSWDWGIFVAAAFPALLFGVAFGNLLQGIPFHFDNDLRSFYTGSFWALLNPFALLTGFISLSMLTMHGSMYLQLKTEGVIAERCKRTIFWSGSLFLVLFILAGIWVAYGLEGYRIVSIGDLAATPNPLKKVVETEPGAWLDNYSTFPWFYRVPVMVLIMTLLTLLFSRTHRLIFGFITSSITISGVILTAGISMYPFLLPSSSHPNNSLTIWDSSSSYMTLKVLFWATLVFLPIIIMYTSWVYRVMRGKVTVKTIRDNQHTAY